MRASDIEIAIELSTMEKTALAAGRMLLEMQPLALSLPTRKDFVSDADHRSEELILRALQARFPEIPILSEEAGGVAVRTGYLWVIDPVDGTINYFLQDEHWGVSIALVKDGQTVAGIVYLPAKDFLFAASNEGRTTVYRPLRGGSWWQCEVNTTANLKECQIWHDWGKDCGDGTNHVKVVERHARLNQHTLYPQMRNGCIASASMVALGRIPGYLFTTPEPFDVAAVGLIVKQAGGTVTDLDGQPWGPFSPSMLATNGLIHDQLLELAR